MGVSYLWCVPSYNPKLSDPTTALNPETVNLQPRSYLSPQQGGQAVQAVTTTA